MLTDYHYHILPGIDDGAENTETSLKMIEMMISVVFVQFSVDNECVTISFAFKMCSFTELINI